MEEKYRGVSWHKTCKKWLAKIRHDGKTIRIGLFESQLEAAKAYDMMALKLKKDCAKLNFGNNQKICDICGNIANGKYKNEMWLCKKHESQMRQYGKIFKRTKFDSNEIIKTKDFCEISLYDQSNIVIAKATVDLKYYDIVLNHKWYLRPGGYVACSNYEEKYVYLHKLIYNIDNKVVNPDAYIDHIDRDKLNCQSSNLREADSSQNGMNRGISKRNTSGKKGVYWCSYYNKWVAHITSYRNRITIGRYDNFEDAYRARVFYENKLFKEFNPINESERVIKNEN